MERRVVTIFLQHKGRVLILKRSGRVTTMRGRWHGVSGYLEEGEDPYARALQEIREEAGLEPEEVALLKQGPPVKSPDAERDGLVWVVHPFLFHASTPKITINWEHDAYRWIRPEEIGEYETVPGLKKLLKRLT